MYCLCLDLQKGCTGEPRYMREIGTQKIDSNIMNAPIKRPRITVIFRIGSRKMAISQSHIRKIADIKVSYNESRLYCKGGKKNICLHSIKVICLTQP